MFSFLIKHIRLILFIFIVFLAYTLVIHHRAYQQGYEVSATKYKDILQNQTIKQLELDNKQKADFEKARKEFDNELQKQQIAINTLNHNANSLRQTINHLRKTPKPHSTARTHTQTETCWILFNESVERYEEMAKEADELNNRLHISQEWLKTQQPSQQQ